MVTALFYERYAKEMFAGLDVGSLYAIRARAE